MMSLSSKILGLVDKINKATDTSSFPYYIKTLPNGALDYERLVVLSKLSGDVEMIARECLSSMSYQNISKSGNTHKVLSKRLFDLLSSSKSGWAKQLLTLTYGRLMTHGIVSGTRDMFAVNRWYKSTSRMFKLKSGGWESDSELSTIQSSLSGMVSSIEQDWQAYVALRASGYGISRMAIKKLALENAESGEKILAVCFNVLGTIASMTEKSVSVVSKSLPKK